MSQSTSSLPPPTTTRNPGCCETISTAKETTRDKRTNRKKPPPWLAQKFSVLLVFALFIFTIYTVVARVCTSYILHGSKAKGIGLMVGFWILWLWELAAYIVVIVVPPGFARDVQGVEKTNAPAYGEYTQQPPPPPTVEAQPGSTTTTDALVPSTPPIQIIAPPQFPILDPAQRYCTRDGFVKPYRAHHCSMCGTCVLKFDHHCPWIGQCVGARNHKFFINFNLSTVLFTSYVFGVLLAHLLQEELDVVVVVDLVFAGMFWMFTLSLLIAHIRLILLGQSTLENVVISSLKDRIRHSGGTFFASSRNLKLFSEEWGKPDTEGNIWYISKKENWEDVMGTNKWGWVFPVGRPQGDGTHYNVNGRFGEGGVWRRRRDWPEEFRRL